TPDEKGLITDGCDGRVIWWPAEEDGAVKPARTIEASPGWIRALAVDANNRFVAAAGNDGLVRVWNANGSQLLHTLTGHEAHVYSLASHPDSSQLFSGDLMGAIHQWTVEQGRNPRQIDRRLLHSLHRRDKVDVEGIRGICVRGDGQYL